MAVAVDLLVEMRHIAGVSKSRSLSSPMPRPWRDTGTAMWPKVSLASRPDLPVGVLLHDFVTAKGP